jgi:hypothetical protein
VLYALAPKFIENFQKTACFAAANAVAVTITALKTRRA